MENLIPIKARQDNKNETVEPSEIRSDEKLEFYVSVEGISVSEKETKKYIKNAIKFWISHYQNDHPKFGISWENAKIKVKIIKEEP